MKAMKGKRKHLSLYVDPEIADSLRTLSTKTRIPQQSLLREAVDDLLAKYKMRVRGTRV